MFENNKTTAMYKFLIISTNLLCEGTEAWHTCLFLWEAKCPSKDTVLENFDQLCDQDTKVHSELISNAVTLRTSCISKGGILS